MKPAARITVRPVPMVGALVLAGLVGAGVHAALPDHRPPAVAPQAAQREVQPAGSGPMRVEAGMPAGFARTQEGAMAAAASFVTTGQALLDMDAFAAEQAVRQMAAADAADGQVRDTIAGLAAARSALADGSGPIVFRQASIAARVDVWSPDRTRVAVWNVGVLSRAGVAPPQAGWAISVFELVWERDDWKVWSETITPGPAPIPDASAAPATSEQLAGALNGFVDPRSGR
ncbi:MAG: hypothetical protein ABR585_13540 [Gemmatimonadaceae bacterium]|nr:hypothetical protein [Actinomycetota bacterium]